MDEPACAFLACARLAALEELEERHSERQPSPPTAAARSVWAPLANARTAVCPSPSSLHAPAAPAAGAPAPPPASAWHSHTGLLPGLDVVALMHAAASRSQGALLETALPYAAAAVALTDQVHILCARACACMHVRALCSVHACPCAQHRLLACALGCVRLRSYPHLCVHTLIFPPHARVHPVTCPMPFHRLLAPTTAPHLSRPARPRQPQVRQVGEAMLGGAGQVRPAGACHRAGAQVDLVAGPLA